MEFQYKAGLGNVGNYQVSGVPYVTGAVTAPTSSNTPIEIVFPSVTQRIHIENLGVTGVKVGFSTNGVKSGGTNYFLVEPKDTSGKNQFYKVDLRVKTDRIFLLSDGAANSNIYIAAELTGIQLNYNLAAQYSGSNGVG